MTDTVKAMNHLKEILKDLGIPKDLIRANAAINRDLQLDSTEIVEISLALKRRLGVKVKLESRQDKTLAEVSDAIASAMTERNN
ncbi:acyl carrier protein [Myxosarcina sp. GI1]|uniref:acyl carrier protein n=1 Tax=Myxosarcina sp. GI1 TaxID=1541065 RepID=UPI001C100C9D|nr:phosphopantetheine-binding protein [Myxosarcina sp. GI1]